jgi:hypothetical protein
MADDVTRINAPDFKTIYTNFVEAGYGPFDISLLLSQSVIAGTMTLTHLARVMMSPAEARVFLGVLQQAIDGYEHTWGKIVPPVFQPDLNKAESKEEQKTEGG